MLARLFKRLKSQIMNISLDTGAVKPKKNPYDLRGSGSFRLLPQL
jgi:hypothetical protein